MARASTLNKALLAFALSALVGPGIHVAAGEPARAVERTDIAAAAAPAAPPTKQPVQTSPPAQAASAAGVTCPAGWVCPKQPLYTAKIGMWYTSWWESTGPEASHWKEWTRYTPQLGYYASTDPKVVQTHFQELKAIGVDYLIFDNTNLVTGGHYRVYSNLTQVVRLDESYGPAEQIPFAMAIGGELWAAHSVVSMGQAVDLIDKQLVPKPLYFRWHGKPLLIDCNGYESPTVVAPDWDDARFSVGICTANPSTSVAVERPYDARGWWGWAPDERQPLSRQVMIVDPGANNAHRHCGGCAVHQDRENGELFMRQWVRAIKQKPETIVVASWNEFSDENAIEPAVPTPGTDAPAWKDYYGTETPDWYVQIATAYAALRTGLMPGAYYRDEKDSATTYQVVDGKLVKQNARPHLHPVISLPAGFLASVR